MEPCASSAIRAEKFTNQPGSINFNLWKQLFIVNINAKGLEVSLQPQNAEELSATKLSAANRADAQLLSELLNTLDKEPRTWALLNYPITEKPVQWAGFLLWNALKKRFDEKPIPQEIHVLKMAILNQKCQNGNAKIFITEIQEKRKHLFSVAGELMNKEKSEIFDFDLIQSILLNLPNRFQAFISIYRSAPPKDQEFSDFAEQVILEDRQMSRPQQHPESAANGIQVQKKWGKKNKKIDKKSSKPSVASVATNLFNLNSNPIKSNVNYSHKINFLLDTGASCHFVRDKSLFIKYKDENSSVILADSSITTSQGIGTILWKTIDKNQKAITIKLNNVRMVPNLKQNLLSLSALFQQYPKAAEIYRNENNIIIKIRNNEIEFKLKDRLFQTLFQTKVKAVKTTISEKEFMHQHIKMGHLNIQDLAILLRKNGFKISNELIKNFICDSCLKTKSTKHRPAEKGRIAGNITSPGSFIHSDIAGPEESYNTTRYIISFIDDHTGATYIKFMRNKSDVPNMRSKNFCKIVKQEYLNYQLGTIPLSTQTARQFTNLKM